MKIDKSTLSTRATKEELIQLIDSVQARRARATEKDVYILEEVEEKLNGILTILDGLEGRLL